MYPVWEGIWLHSGMYIALIASFHVLVSHLTVAAAWFNLYLERRAVKENQPEFYQYLKKSALGLLVFAYVFGALSGVGIWFSTTAGNPRGISTLIHSFVFYWASEWYMFWIDVAGIIAYYYTLNKVSNRTHLKLAWILALGSTGTLVIIVGILAFKLTPGAWLATGQSLDGFFNPTFWPQLMARFFAMFAITGVWAVAVAAQMPKSSPYRNEIIRDASAFGLLGLVLSGITIQYWFLPAVPESARALLQTPAVPSITFTLIAICAIVVVAYYLQAIAWPKVQHWALAVGALAVLFSGVFGLERVRELLRKPDIVAGYLSSNQIVIQDMPARGIKAEEEALNQTGTLDNLPFLADSGSPMENGRRLVTQQCSSCHTTSTQTTIKVGQNGLALRSVARLFQERNMTSPQQIETYLGALGGFPYMHPVIGTQEEKAAMAIYLADLVAEFYPSQQGAQR